LLSGRRLLPCRWPVVRLGVRARHHRRRAESQPAQPHTELEPKFHHKVFRKIDRRYID
jgi:hypothetical protein